MSTPNPTETRRTGRYRKVEVRTWGDAKFRSLSPIPPCGQGLWLFLITGPHTGPIPGLFRAGRAALAEELGWEIEDFDKAFGEALQQGMVEADFKARVMWIPKAIKHNKPESPNVVKSWASEFDLIPECDLKWKAFQALKTSIHALGEAYGKAFDEAFQKPSGKPSTKTSPNQEQEQEQETGTGNQEKDAQRKRSASPLAVDRPEDVDEQTWTDWQRLRKAKKAPVTETVLTVARTESQKAGMALDAFLQVWCLRGSQGLMADWLRPEERRTASRVQPNGFAHQEAGATSVRAVGFQTKDYDHERL